MILLLEFPSDTMRKKRSITAGQCCHLYSRIAHRTHYLTDDEKDRFIDLLHRVSDFSGVLLLAYNAMSNHFHVFIFVPEPEELSHEQLLARIWRLYRNRAKPLVQRLCRLQTSLLTASPATAAYHQQAYDRERMRYFKRMWNASMFMKTFKQHFSMSFNARHAHAGTMWEGRFHDRTHAPTLEVLSGTAAYIDANGVRAGIVESPADYPWCSFAAAERGDGNARKAYGFIYDTVSAWTVVREMHLQTIRDCLAKKPDAPSRPHRSIDSSHEENRNAGAQPPAEVRTRKDLTTNAILRLLVDGPLKASEIMGRIGLQDYSNFHKRHLSALLQRGLITRTNNQHPRAQSQTYSITPLGLKTFS